MMKPFDSVKAGIYHSCFLTYFSVLDKKVFYQLIQSLSTVAVFNQQYHFCNLFFNIYGLEGFPTGSLIHFFTLDM